MKNMFLAMLFMLPVLAIAQDASTNNYLSKPVNVTPTTVEEYNYLVRGLKIQLESGLDMKAGYSLKNLFNYKYSNTQFETKYLIRTNKNQIAAILVTMQNVGWGGEKRYMCIPFGDNELFSNFESIVASLDATQAKGLSVLFTKIFTHYMGYNVLPTLAPDYTKQ